MYLGFYSHIVDCPTQLTLLTWICQLCSTTNTSEKYERTQQGNLLNFVQMRGGRALTKFFVHFSQTVHIGSLGPLPKFFGTLTLKKSGTSCPATFFGRPSLRLEVKRLVTYIQLLTSPIPLSSLIPL